MSDCEQPLIGLYRCDNCADEVREPEASGEWDCVVCGGRMELVG